MDVLSSVPLLVVKRNGETEEIDINKIKLRLDGLIAMPPALPMVNSQIISLKCADKMCNLITTKTIDLLTADIAYNLCLSTPNYGKLAARIIIDNHSKSTLGSFSDKVSIAYRAKLIDVQFYKYVKKYSTELNAMIVYSRDFKFDYFGFLTFQRQYSLRIDGVPIERPQDMFMRTAVALNMYSICDNGEVDPLKAQQELANIAETYECLSKHLYTHASPTYYNAGSANPQYASCFLLGTTDSLEGITKSCTDMAKISKWAGGLGIHIDEWRSAGMRINSTNGTSSGIVPFVQMMNATVMAFNQGGRRPGSAKVYIMPHHPDFPQFIELRRNTGQDSMRARNLFYAIWMPDLFMKRVKDNGQWSMFDPTTYNLSDLYGDAYEAKYLELEAAGKFVHQKSARELWDKIIQVNAEVGMPDIIFSDTVNKTSMQKNFGTIKSSNLCVDGSTLVLTSCGYIPIKDLACGFANAPHMSESRTVMSDARSMPSDEKEIKLWNGSRFTPATVFQTSPREQLYRVTLTDGTSIKCTAYHKFATGRGEQPANELIFHNGAMSLAASYCGSDFVHSLQHKPMLGDSIDYYDLPIIYSDCWVGDKNYSMHDRRMLLQQIVNSVAELDEEYGIVFSNSDVSRDRLCHIQLVAQTLGIRSIVETVHGVDFLRIENSELHKLVALDIIDKSRISTVGGSVSKIYVSSVEKLDEFAPVYCFNEPYKHLGLLNGMLTKNCNEIVQYSSDKEYATCILSSVSLSACVVDMADPPNHEFPTMPMFDFNALKEVVYVVVRNLNLLMEKTCFPVEEARYGCKRQRAIGVGVQGLDDAYAKMRYPFDSDEARALNKKIFETIYFAALSKSSILAKEEEQRIRLTNPNAPRYCGAYPMFEGSPLSQGKFHWELYAEHFPSSIDVKSLMCNWDDLRLHIQRWGVRNSMVVALMPTATTSQLLGNIECFEPCTRNLYKRETNAGEFYIVKKYMINDLINLGLWNENLKSYLICLDGSIQHVEGIPDELKRLYKTAYELDPSVIIQQAIDRQPFVDQAQSMNLFLTTLDVGTWKKIMSMAWRGGLKTGKYYLHTASKVTPTKFTIDAIKVKEVDEMLQKKAAGVMSVIDKDVCDFCSA